MPKELPPVTVTTRKHGCFTVVNVASDKEPAEILIYEQIGQDWFGESGVNARDFAEALKEIPKDRQIVVAINSPGGNVWDGLAIYHQLEARKQYVTTRVDGIAASIASVIAMAGREVQMPKNALLMIHDPSAIVMGDAEDMRTMADRLDMLAENLADIYSRKTKKSKETMRAAMRAETFYTGDEAAAMGLADMVLADAQIAASLDLADCKRMLAALITKNKTAAQAGGATQSNEMNKTQIVALLTKHGVTVEASATDEQLMTILGDTLAKANAKKLEPNPAPAEPANVIALQKAIDSLQAANEAERKLRLKREVTALAEAGHIPINAVDGWTARALKDETIVDEIKKLPIHREGVDPIFNVITNEGNPLVEKYKVMPPGAERNAFRLANDSEMRKQSKNIVALSGAHRPTFFDPRNANTLAAALTPDYLADGLIINARNRLAPLAAFSRDFGTDPMKPKATVQVARATVGATAQTDATNWESGDTTLAAVAVTVNQKSVSFHLTNDQLNKGHLMANLAGINADQLADAISDVWTALLVVGTYGTPGAGTGIIGAATAFDPADIPQLFSLAKNFRARNLILDGSYIGYLMPGVIANFNSGLGVNDQGVQSTYFGRIFGMDGIWMQSRYTSAVANCVGFLCGPDAIAVASGLPIATATPNSEFLSQQTVNIDGAGSNAPSIGLSVQVNMWYSRATRTIWASYDVMFGAAAGDASTTLTLGQGRLLVSA